MHSFKTRNMKTVLFSILIFLTSIMPIYAQEVTLFNSEGEAVAYIDYEKDATIFLWKGTPVAFLKNDGGDMCVFGFNGNFLGWYENGIIYDENGNAVSIREGAVNMATQIEPIKGIQEITIIRPITPITPIQPIWSNRWSSKSLIEFLYSGKK